jgi:hypothetical protein
MRILFPTTFLPGMRRTGGEVATQGFVDAMRAVGHEVTLLGYRRVGTDPPTAPSDIAVADRHIETLGAGARPVSWMLRAVLTRQPYSLAKYVSRAYVRALRDAFAATRPELVVLEHAQMAWLVPDGGWDVPMVYLSQNVEHAMHAELARHGGLRALAHRREARRLRAVEKELLERAREHWALSQGDAEALATLAPDTPARVFDVPPATVPELPGPAVHEVVALGGWHWRPNAAGLRWFVEEVAPQLPPGGPEVVVGGHSADEIVGDRAGVRAVGFVPDALEFLQSGRIVVVPSIAGGGVQVKTLDAIASGRRVIATSIAMRGIDDPPPTVEVADDAREFAAAIALALEQEVDGAAAAQAREWAVARRERFHEAIRDAVAAATA